MTYSDRPQCTSPLRAGLAEDLGEGEDSSASLPRFFQACKHYFYAKELIRRPLTLLRCIRVLVQGCPRLEGPMLKERVRHYKDEAKCHCPGALSIFFDDESHEHMPLWVLEVLSAGEAIQTVL